MCILHGYYRIDTSTCTYMQLFRIVTYKYVADFGSLVICLSVFKLNILHSSHHTDSFVTQSNFVKIIPIIVLYKSPNNAMQILPDKTVWKPTK